jgi:hypothetical protein
MPSNGWKAGRHTVAANGWGVGAASWTANSYSQAPWKQHKPQQPKQLHWKCKGPGGCGHSWNQFHHTQCQKCGEGWDFASRSTGGIPKANPTPKASGTGDTKPTEGKGADGEPAGSGWVDRRTNAEKQIDVHREWECLCKILLRNVDRPDNPLTHPDVDKKAAELAALKEECKVEVSDDRKLQLNTYHIQWINEKQDKWNAQCLRLNAKQEALTAERDAHDERGEEIIGKSQQSRRRKGQAIGSNPGQNALAPLGKRG